MDDEPKDRPSRSAESAAINLIDTSTTKKRSASTDEYSGRAQKARKHSHGGTTPPPVDKGAEGVGALFNRTPASKRIPSHSSLIGRENIIYAADMETQIVAEARGVTRKNIPWDTFRSTYLCNFGVKPQPQLEVNSVKNVGEGNWEEQVFYDRLRGVLSGKVLRDLKLFHGGTRTLPDVTKGKEVSSKPDFVLHVGDKSPIWADVELLFEHTRSSQRVVTTKFLQWLRGAWSVFHHQPFRRHLYGIMFLQPCAYICYADHGCAVYSEPLSFATYTQHTEFLIEFLAGFIADPELRGRDPTVEKADNNLYIHHAEKKWVELHNGLLWYRPCLVGRNIRVAWVEPQGVKFPQSRVVMKSTWEEKLSPESSPPSEVEVLKILLEANVRGLPQPYDLDSAIVRDGGNLEVETRGFPEDCEIALQASTEVFMDKMELNYVSNHTSKPMEKMQLSYASNRTSKPMAPGATKGFAGDPLLGRAKIQRQQFNEPLDVRRRLTRIVMSYCTPLKEAMRDAGPKTLMRTIRDAMIVYYEAYKLPGSGFIHGDISVENILVPGENSVLTGGLTYEHRRGTVVDWNLCFNADGSSSGRVFKSGTPAFMAPILLDDKPIARRTLCHDMESFFAVIIWIASLDYQDEPAFLAKPLANILLDKKAAPKFVVRAKRSWFYIQNDFRTEIIKHFTPFYGDDRKFVSCLSKLRRILYHDSDEDDNGGEGTGSTDPMKEGLFRMCMEAMDEYLDETKGCREMNWINAEALTRHTPQSLVQEGNRVD